MLKKNSMKRAVPAAAFSYQSQPFDGEAAFRLKHQSLLEDYLKLQKESVSKKKKLQAAQQRRETLLHEVCFLRQRHAYLMKIRSHDLEPRQDLVRQESPSAEREVVGEVARVEKKQKKGKGVGKKKLSWQDPVALKV